MNKDQLKKAIKDKELEYFLSSTEQITTRTPFTTFTEKVCPGECPTEAELDGEIEIINYPPQECNGCLKAVPTKAICGLRLCEKCCEQFVRQCGICSRFYKSDMCNICTITNPTCKVFSCKNTVLALELNEYQKSHVYFLCQNFAYQDYCRYHLVV